MITVISSKSGSQTVAEVQALLLTHETWLEGKSTATDSHLPSVHNVSLSPKEDTTLKYGHSSASSSPSTGFDRSHSVSYRGRGGRFSWGGGRIWNNRNKPQCQLCFKFGHTASKCFYHFPPRPPQVPPRSYNPLPNSSPYSPLPTAFSPMSAMLTQPNQPHESTAWYPDSGATHHLTHDLNNLSIGSEYGGAQQIHVASGQGLPILNYGFSSFKSPVNSTRILHLNHLLHVPTVTKNLLSVSQFARDNGVYFEFHPSLCYVKDQITGQVLLQGTLHNGLYKFNLSPASMFCAPSSSLHTSVSLFPTVNFSVLPSLDTWHKRLGHPAIPIVKRVLQSCNTRCSMSNEIKFCDACALGKHHALPFTCSKTVYTKPLQLIICDIWGPAYISSHNGFRYYISFVDAYSRFTWVYFLKSKSDALQAFVTFRTLVEKLLNTPILRLQTDGGGEFKSFVPFLRAHGIEHRQTCPYTSQQNGLVERKHRHIVDTGLSLLAHSSLPFKFWDEAFFTSVYLINRLPSSVHPQVSPLEILWKVKPEYSFLRTFGCKCFPCLRPYNNHKLSYRTSPCTFLGYSSTQKGYKCLSSTGRIFVSRHVLFDENSFPFAHNISPRANVPCSPVLLPSLTTESRCATSSSNLYCPTSPTVPSVGGSPRCDTSSPTEAVSLGNATSSPSITPVSPVSPSLSTLPPTSSTSSVVPPRLPSLPRNSHPMVTRGKNGIFKPKAFLVDYTQTEPTTAREALKCPEWRQAMQEEYDALLVNKTWDLVPMPTGQKVVGCKWVFKIKRNSDGSIARYKARLVAKGFHQTADIDYTETFSPVVKPITIRVLLTLALYHGWTIRQVDINNAFLHGVLTESVFMEQPDGFQVPSASPGLACHLKKAIYGLKQAPRAWYDQLSIFLKSLGFTTSRADTSLMVRLSSAHCCYVLIYVDDIIIMGSSSVAISTLISDLHRKFALKDLGPLSYFLGVEVFMPPSGGMFLSQKKYILDLLSRTKMTDAKAIATPMISGPLVSTRQGDLFSDVRMYRSVVGALQYATLTRPEISFSVNKVCQFMHSPTILHWQMVKRILRYLKGTMDHGLFLHRPTHLGIHGFADADWASDPDDRKSTSGFCVFFGGNLISWGSKKQSIISRSSTEAEYRCLATVATEMVWLRSLFLDLHICLSNPPVLWCDNLSAVHLSANPILHSKTKHVELDIYFVRDLVLHNKLIVRHLPALEQIADVLTKPLSAVSFARLKSKLNVCSPPTIGLRGDVKIAH